MKRSLLITTVIAMMAAAASCSSEPVPQGRVSDAAGSIVVPVHFRILPGMTAKSSYAQENEIIREFFLAAYCGGSLRTFFHADSLGMQDVCLDLEASQEYNFYAIANCPGINPDNLQEEDAMKGIALGINPEENCRFPLYAMFSSTVDESGDPMPVILSRLVAKWSFKIDRSSLPSLSIKSVAVRNSATMLYPFCIKDMEVNYDCVPAQDGDFLTEEDIEAVNSGEEAVFYVPENRQGTLLDGMAGTYGKTSQNLLDAGYNPGRCTYIEITAGFDGPRPPFSGEIVYRFYLGEDASSNFDVIRNTARSVTFSPTYESATSSEIQWLVQNDGVTCNSYGELHVFSLNQFLQITREVSGEEVRLLEYSTGFFRAFFVDEDLGINENVTSSVTWHFAEAPENKYSASSKGIPARNISSSLPDITKKATVILQYEREDLSGQTQTYETYFSTFNVKYLGREDPDDPLLEYPEIKVTKCNADGTKEKVLNDALDQTFRIGCAVIDNTYRCLKVTCNYTGDYWKSIRVRVSSGPAYNFVLDAPADTSGKSIVIKDLFSLVDIPEDGFDNVSVLQTNLGDKNSLTVELFGLSDEWNLVDQASILTSVQFAMPLEMYATVDTDGTAYPCVKIAWKGADSQDRIRTYQCLENMEISTASLPKWFQYTGTTIKYNNAVLKAPLPFSTRFAFSNEVPDQDGLLTDVASRPDITERTTWYIPYAYPGLNFLNMGGNVRYPVWVSTYDKCGKEGEVSLVKGY